MEETSYRVFLDVFAAENEISRDEKFNAKGGGGKGFRSSVSRPRGVDLRFISGNLTTEKSLGVRHVRSQPFQPVGKRRTRAPASKEQIFEYTVRNIWKILLFIVSASQFHYSLHQW